ncbi:hypothetical protein [Dyadobacter bucti]|uniref:hypothetical protein n=1 Tax=Dyadobacter bucti TaxID=2572203 RepID=UPI003F6FA339
MTEKALAFIEKNKRRLFFLYMPYTIPHVSLQVPDQYAKQYIGQFIYWEYPEKGGRLAIRMGNGKSVKTDLKKKPDNAWQIFDLKNDRGETTDVASQHPELAEQFDLIVKREHQDPGIAIWRFVEKQILMNPGHVTTAA